MFSTLTSCTYGPAKPSIFSLRGIRFVEGEDGKPGDENKPGDGFKPPANQAELDKILEGRLARERATTAEKYKDYDQLKAAADELARVKDEKKTPDQKAIDDAKEEGRAEIRSVLAGERVQNAFTKALEGRALNPAALLDFDKSKFVKGDGADEDAIKTWVEANSTEVKAEENPKPKDRGQGKRGATEGGNVQSGRELFENRKTPKKTS